MLVTDTYANKNGINTSNDPDTISVDSNDLLGLSFEEEKPMDQKKPAKEMFKTIYGLGQNADKMRLLE